MTEGYGSGYGDEAGQRASGRGAVTERLARQDRDGAHEADVTDEAQESQESRESSGAFEPAAPTADPPAEAERPGSSSIFDIDERARQEDLNRTGYEPPMADPDATPDGPRGETTVTEPGEAREEPAATPAGDADAAPGSADITPTPVPVAEPTADTPAPHGLPEPAAAAETPAAEATAAAADAAAAAETPAAAGTSASLLGSLDAAAIRTRFLDIQAGFVDEPRQAVEEAGRFVDDLVRQVAEALKAQRGQLAGAAAEGSTEDLRLALRAYRQFVDRLLGMAG